MARWVKVIGWVEDNHHPEICGFNIFAKFVRQSRKLAALSLSNAKNSVSVVVHWPQNIMKDPESMRKTPEIIATLESGLVLVIWAARLVLFDLCYFFRSGYRQFRSRIVRKSL